MTWPLDDGAPRDREYKPLALNETEQGDYGLCDICGGKMERVGSCNGHYFRCRTACVSAKPALPDATGNA